MRSLSALSLLLLSLPRQPNALTMRSRLVRSSISRVSLMRMSAATSETPSIKMSKVCVVGGGFGGLYSALKLNKLAKDSGSPVEIFLIDDKDKFVFLPLLYELTVGTASIIEVAPRYETLLKDTSIKFIQGRVSGISDSAITVETRSEDDLSIRDTKHIDFDQLILATGAQPRTDTIPGADEFAQPFATVEHAYKLKARLRVLSTRDKGIIRVAVIGGGYSGVEVATSIAEYLGRDRVVVSVIDRNAAVMNSSPIHNRRIAEKSLLHYGVSLQLNTSVVSINEDSVIVKDDTGTEMTIPTDLVILTCGIQPSALVAKLTLPKHPSGRLLVHRSLQSVGATNVFALGDCAAVDGVSVPLTAQAAMQQADIVAKNVLTSLNSSLENPPILEKFRFVPLGEMLTLGGSVIDASVYSLGGLVELNGPLAAIARRAVYAARMPTTTQAVTAAVSAGVVSFATLLLKATSRSTSSK